MHIEPISRKRMIRRSARLFAEKSAVVEGDRVLSFAQVDERANRLANGLRGLNVGPRERVATLLGNCLEYAEIEFGLVKASLPQVTLNPRLTATEQLFQLQETECKVLILQDEYADAVKPILGKLGDLKAICLGRNQPGTIAYDALLAEASTVEPDGELEPDDIGEIRYTSGTTGQPKGVVLPYWSRMAITRNFFVDHMSDFTLNDKFLALQPLYHGAGWFTFPVWVKGATHYIVPRYDPDIAFETIEKHGVTVIKTVPTVLLRMLDAPDLRKRRLRSVRTIMYGGSPMPVERLKEAMQVFGPVFLGVYGQMEAAMTISLLRKEEHSGEWLRSVGKPCTFVEVKVVGEDGSELPPGEVGEVVIKGDHQMTGYFKRPEATAKSIRNGWIHSNDLGKIDKDGCLYLTGGRKSEMIISGGLNVYPAEVEQALFLHPAVADAAVIGLAHPIWGEAVTGCVVLKAGTHAAAEEILSVSAKALADYKRPKAVIFFEKLPRNPAGKVIYAELRKECQKRHAKGPSNVH